MKYVKLFVSAVIIVMIYLFSAAHPVFKGYIYVLNNFIASSVIVVAYLGFGLKIMKVLKINGGPVKYPMAFAVSVVIVGTVFFIAGFAGLYNRVFAYVMLAILTVFSYSQIRVMVQDTVKFLKTMQPPRLSPSSLVYFTAAGAVFIYWFFTCLTPPVYYDTLVYHLGVPEQYIQAGRIINMKENIFSFYPQLMQMNCLFSMLIADELSVKLMYFFMGIMSLTALAGIAGEMKADKKIAVLLLLACPLFLLNSSRIGAELPLMFFTLLLVYIMIKALDSGLKNGDGLMAGLISGMIISVKYTGVVVYFFGAVLFIYLFFKKKAAAGRVITYLLVPVFIVAPYLVKNYFFTGDPVYPFFTDFFDVVLGLKMDAAQYVSHVNGFGLAHNFMNMLKSPFEAVYNSKLFGGDVMSPLFLVAFVLLPLTDIKKTWLPALFMLFYFITWFFTGEVLRFLLPVIPIAALIAASAYTNSQSKLKYLAFGLLVAVQAGSSVYFGEKYLKPFLLFAMDRKEYISRQVTYNKAAEFININTLPAGKVLMLGEARTYYLRRQALAYTVFNSREIFTDFAVLTEAEALETILNSNISYILFNRTEMSRLRDSGYGDLDTLFGTEKFKNVMDKFFKKIYSDDNCEVYMLTGRL